MSIGLWIGLAGFVLWWAGFYGGLVVAWRAGSRKMVPFAIAAVLGLCGCLAIPLLAYFWSEVQKRTFAAVDELPEDAPAPPYMRHFQIAAGVAAVGLVLQILGGNLLPDDDGYDDGGWESSYEDGDDYAYDPVEDYEPEPTPSAAPDELDEAWEDWEDHAYEDEAEDEPEDDADPETESETVAEAEPQGDTLRGVLVGLTGARRFAAVLVAEQVSFARRARGRFPVSLSPCTSVSFAGEWDDDVFVVDETTEEGDGCGDLPRPEVVRSFDAPLTGHAGRYVLLPAPHAETPTRLRFTEELTLAARGPRGAITRDTDYTAVRGVLVDTSRVDRRGGLELWVLREDDLVGM